MFNQFRLLLLRKCGNIVKDNTNSMIISVCFSLTTNTFIVSKQAVFHKKSQNKLTHPSTAKTAVTIMWPIRMITSAEVSCCGGVVCLSATEAALKVWEWKTSTTRHTKAIENSWVKETQKTLLLYRNPRPNRQKIWFNTCPSPSTLR